jgi:hypothetical protein
MMGTCTVSLSPFYLTTNIKNGDLKQGSDMEKFKTAIHLTTGIWPCMIRQTNHACSGGQCQGRPKEKKTGNFVPL